MNRYLPWLLIVFFSLFNPTSSWALGDFQASPWTKEPTYSEKSINKLGFGIMNTLTGWDALFFEPYRRRNLLTGLIPGILLAVTNTAGGAIHALTFPIPVDLPLPGGGVNFDTE